ncbi:MAG TPA: hypothetical protein VHX90_08415 [Verrucomicrobiae bacterium]|jgi:hypothetical protein|nr:hypothetical protein [Verrucomicrobiae bacterium]
MKTLGIFSGNRIGRKRGVEKPNPFCARRNSLAGAWKFCMLVLQVGKVIWLAPQGEAGSHYGI